MSRTELTPAMPQLTENELEMATSLVNAMSIAFKPEEYKDDYQRSFERKW